MLEQLLIFTRGGLILWTWRELSNALKGSPIDTLIRSCLLEERSGAASYNYDAAGASYSLKWTFHNDLGLVFVAVYQRILHLLYVDDLLAAVKREFSQIYDEKRTEYQDFDEIFRQLKAEAEARAEDLKKANPVGRNVAGGGGNSNSKKQGLGHKVGSEGGGGKKKSAGGDDGDGDGKKGVKLENGHSNENSVVGKGTNLKGSSVNVKENESSNLGAFDVNRLQKLRSKGGNVKKGDGAAVAKGSSKAEPPKKAVKKNRVWDDSPVETKLDFTDHGGEDVGGRNVDFLAKEQGESMMDRDEVVSSESEDEEDDDDNGKNIKPDAKKKGWFSSMFQR